MDTLINYVHSIKPPAGKGLNYRPTTVSSRVTYNAKTDAAGKIQLGQRAYTLFHKNGERFDPKMQTLQAFFSDPVVIQYKHEFREETVTHAIKLDITSNTFTI